MRSPDAPAPALCLPSMTPWLELQQPLSRRLQLSFLPASSRPVSSTPFSASNKSPHHWEDFVRALRLRRKNHRRTWYGLPRLERRDGLLHWPPRACIAVMEKDRPWVATSRSLPCTSRS